MLGGRLRILIIFRAHREAGVLGRENLTPHVLVKYNSVGISYLVLFRDIFNVSDQNVMVGEIHSRILE